MVMGFYMLMELRKRLMMLFLPMNIVKILQKLME